MCYEYISNLHIHRAKKKKNINKHYKQVEYNKYFFIDEKLYHEE